MQRFIVIGAGIVGASVAYALSAAGASVTIIEASRPVAGTSSRSFAWTNANRKPPRAYHALNAAGLAEHHRLAGTLPGGWFQPVGNLIWQVEPADRAALRQNVEQLQGWGYHARLIERDEAQALAPGLRLPPAGAADYAFAPDEGWVAVAPLVDHLLSAAQRAGATLHYPAPVERLVVTGQRVGGVAVNGQSLAADTVIDCTGPAAGRLLEPLGLAIRRRRSPGLLAVTEPATTGLERVVHAPTLHLRPDGSGRLLLGSDPVDAELAVADGQIRLDPDAAPAQALLERARALVPALAAVGLETTRVGWRPMPADGLSAVGPVPGLSGYYLVFTHSGVTLGPLLGRLTAAELTTGESSPLLADFRPDRLVTG